MNKKNKYGFTLVELLAVIVILAVVILIAVTAVIPRMNKAKKNALVDEALVYLNAAKESLVFDVDDIGSKCINISDLNENYVKKDSSDYNGVIKININNDNISYVINLTDGKFYLTGSDNLTSSDVKDNMPQGFASSCGDYNPIIADGADTNTLAYKLLMAEGGSTLDANLEIINNRSQNVSFNTVASTSTNAGLYKAEDDDGATYYYRGAVDNNWVEFAGFYWRIVRINGDGSVRLIYSGTKSSNHTGTNAQIKTSPFSDTTSYTTTTTDITGLTNTQVTTTYSNGRYGNTYVGYMYNPAKVLYTHPEYELSTTKNLGTFPTFTNIDNTKQYYLFKNFDMNADCFTGSDNDESGTCTLKCNNLGDDCILTNWNTQATNTSNYSTSDAGATSSAYVYTSDYVYTCWGYGTAVTKNNSNNTTSVYISCPVVSEIVGTVKNQATQAKVKYHGLFSSSEGASNSNVKDSKIKTELESWYETNIYNKKDGTEATSKYYEEYLADEIFCGDRSTTKTNQTFPLTGSDHFYYSPYTRLTASTKAPSYKCANKSNDGFTLGSSTNSIVSQRSSGNGQLRYPVGLITADEASYAGGVYGSSNTNSGYYLYTGATYWTMSPCLFYASNAIASVWYVYSTGYLTYSNPTSSYGVRPVINLSSSVLYDSGNGQEATPYKVKLQ
ncbi:MAG: prepilin-type N-terminal cleavage/methylation domain-containing protein [Bacilli bacterium]|nr:prepilin-type N-terminal cleavage/methylation domain-containing protein [Bacilli bacterium]